MVCFIASNERVSPAPQLEYGTDDSPLDDEVIGGELVTKVLFEEVLVAKVRFEVELFEKVLFEVVLFDDAPARVASTGWGLITEAALADEPFDDVPLDILPS